MSNELVEAIIDMNEDEALEIVEAALERGDEPTKLLADCQQAMGVVGERFENGEYFLPELMMSGALVSKIADMLKPRLAMSGETKCLGKVLIGTVRSDIHDIGKDIVTLMLDANGFYVKDLGVDVSEEKFVQAAKDFAPDIVALSGLLTVSHDSMKSTISAFKEAGIRENVKIMIGGGQINEAVRDYTGADAFGNDAVSAVSLARRWRGAN